ncbi:methylmalonyl-CoA mutase [Cupriavidus sp. 30B13]|uniref:methylmalonyl-CoA mutase n=1 Tax=Cupriavidus sp. 30B13 TaxID=3384241 RepID=UPI003B8F629B
MSAEDHAVPRRPVYTAADLDGIAHLGTLPGEAPFVRGVHRTMHAGKPWTIRQYAGYADATASNLAFRTALAQGTQGLSVAFDLPTHRGYDSDHPLAQADVGMAGVAIDSVEDMKRLFEGIALDRVSVSMTMSGAVLPVLAAFLVAGEESGVPLAQLSGTIQNDILKEYMVRNAWIFAPGPSMRIAGDVVAWLARHVPRFNGMSISGYHFQEAGADPVLELALTLANGRAYVEAIRERGIGVDAFCGTLSFFFGVGKDFYLEIAKLRAARLLWWEIVQAAGGTSARAGALRMHCQTSGWSLTARQPQNNVVRTTVEAMAAVFGGTQSLHTNAYDEALALPGADASRLARDTQLILQREMGLCDVADPWAGSYMMESLTGEVARKVRALMAEIEARGGVHAALASGWVHAMIARSAARTQARIDSGEQAIIGVNQFVAPDEEPACFAVDGRAVLAAQAQRLATLKAGRDPAALRRALSALTAAARGGSGNLLALAIDAMRCRATVGECTAALEQVWPRHQASPVFAQGEYGGGRAEDAAWEQAAARVRALGARLGRAPRILVAKLGLDGHDRGAKAVAAALSDAGFAVTLGPLFRQPEDVAAEVARGGFDAVGISTLAGAHLALLPRFLQALAAARLRTPVFAGGIVPDADARLLLGLGVRALFGPGTAMEAIVRQIAGVLEEAEAALHDGRIRASADAA